MKHTACAVQLLDQRGPLPEQQLFTSSEHGQHPSRPQNLGVDSLPASLGFSFCELDNRRITLFTECKPLMHASFGDGAGCNVAGAGL
jgi:hypothetical protein